MAKQTDRTAYPFGVPRDQAYFLGVDTLDTSKSPLGTTKAFEINKISKSYATRAALVADLGAGLSLPDGAKVSVAGLEFIASTGATDISDLPGLIPFGIPSPLHWGFVEGSGVSAAIRTANTTAANAAAAYNGIVQFPPGTFEIDGPIVFDAVTSTPETGVSAASICGAGGSIGTTLVQTNLDENAIQVIDSGANEYKFRPHIKDLNFVYPTGAAPNTDTAAILLRQCNAGAFENLTIDGPDIAIECQRVVQSHFRHIYFRTAKRDGGNHATAFFVFDHDASTTAGTSFGNTVVDCEAQPSNANTIVDKAFVLRAVDGLEILGGHYNNSRRHVSIEPDGTGGRTTVRDVTIYGTYFDCNNPSGAPLEQVIGLEPITSGASTVFGLRVENCKIRTSETYATNVFRVPGGAGDADGLTYLRDISFVANHITGFGASSIINFALDASYDPRTLIRNITIRNNIIRDAGDDQSHSAANANALVLQGENFNVGGNIYRGNWTDAGSNVITADKVNGLIIDGEIFDTPRTATNISLSGTVVDYRSYGHVSRTYTNDTGQVLEIVESGSNANGYYEIYSTGKMMCRKRVSTAATPITTAFGSIFISATVSSGVWPSAFAATPENVQITAYGTSGTAWGGRGSAPDATNAPGIKFYRGTSATIDVAVDITAWGDAP